MSDWTQLKSEIQQGDKWRGTANIPVGDDVLEIKIRKLTESERQDEINPRLDMEAIMEHNDDESEAEQTVKELQQADDLTDEEEERLAEAQDELVEQNAELLNDLGADTFQAIREAGIMGIVPDNEDINGVLNESPSASAERFGSINKDDRTDAVVPDFGPEDRGPIPQTRDEAKRALEAEMEHWLTLSRRPLKFTIGQQVIATSQGEGK